MDSSMNATYPDDASLLSWLASRCQRNLAADERAQEYLRSNGVSDEKIWQDYRLGVGDERLLDEMDDAGRERMRALELLTHNNIKLLDGGIIIPTFNPRKPDLVVGLIKHSFTQNRHAFLMPPSGVACRSDIASNERIIVSDTPLLGLRLAQAGANGGIMIAETPEVLTPLLDWLKGRKLALVSYKKERLDALKQSLGALAQDAQAVTVRFDLAHTKVETLALLGVERSNFSPAMPEAELATHARSIVADLVAFAQARLKNGEGLELLRTLGADDAEFIGAYGLGYLPKNFQGALSKVARLALSGKLHSNSVLIPAFDDNGVPMDAMVVAAKRLPRKESQFLDVCAGLIAPRIASAFPEIIATDSFKFAAASFKAGIRNVVLLRGAEDARHNAARLRASGVRAATVVARHDAHEIATILEQAGIDAKVKPCPRTIDAATVKAEDHAGGAKEPSAHSETTSSSAPAQLEMSTPSDIAAEYPDKPTLISHDERMMRARFQDGDAIYEIDTALDCGSRLEVSIEREGQKHRDRFDLGKAMQRKRFSESAAIKVQVPFEIVERHLIFLLDAVREIQEEILEPGRKKTALSTSLMSETEKKEAATFLKDANLLETVAADLEQMGWAGEPANKRLLYLCCISRLLPMPLSASLRAPAASGKSFAIETATALVPPEDIVHISRASATAFHLHPDLRHKMVIIDEADALTQEVIIALRVLQSRGALSQSVVERDPATGKAVTRVAESNGPVAVLTCTTGEMDDEFLSRCYGLTADTSEKQTALILDMQRRLRGDAGFAERRAGLVRKHQNVQRLLTSEHRPVLIPYADRIEFPSTAVQFRREQQKLLSLIEASALLHSFSRMKERGENGQEHVVADIRDFEIASGLIADLIRRASDELSSNAREVLEFLKVDKLTAFTLSDIKAKRGDWTRHRIYTGLEELAQLEIVACSRGRGKPRKYMLLPGGKTADAAVVRLRPAGTANQLSPTANNFATKRKSKAAAG